MKKPEPRPAPHCSDCEHCDATQAPWLVCTLVGYRASAYRARNKNGCGKSGKHFKEKGTV